MAKTFWKRLLGKRKTTIEDSQEESPIVMPYVDPFEEPLHSHCFHVMVKPTGPACNLRCEYCFYLEKQSLLQGDESYQMQDDTLKAFIKRYIRACGGKELTFSWQGGEPTLLGVDFFRRVVDYEKKYTDGRPIRNTLQTNGTLLDDEWCEFLARENFLVGLSIDGPKQIHDRYRVKADGSGSFDDVMRGLRLLKKHGVEFNSLTCVPAESAGHGREVYRFLRDQGIRYMQFIPIVERVPGPRATELGLDADVPPYLEDEPRNKETQPYTIESEAYGRFLIDIFKTWVKRDVGRIYVNHFDLALAAWIGAPPGLCVYSKQCGTAVAMEYNGDVYTCDHFVYPEYLLGNVKHDSFDRMFMTPLQWEFRLAKSGRLPGDCKECKYRSACHGGCPKHRFLRDSTDKPGLNYLCAGFKKFFDFADPYLTRMAELHKMQQPAADIMSERPPKRGSGPPGGMKGGGMR